MSKFSNFGTVGKISRSWTILWNLNLKKEELKMKKEKMKTINFSLKRWKFCIPIGPKTLSFHNFNFRKSFLDQQIWLKVWGKREQKTTKEKLPLNYYSQLQIQKRFSKNLLIIDIATDAGFRSDKNAKFSNFQKEVDFFYLLLFRF